MIQKKKLKSFKKIWKFEFKSVIIWHLRQGKPLYGKDYLCLCPDNRLQEVSGKISRMFTQRKIKVHSFGCSLRDT